MRSVLILALIALAPAASAADLRRDSIELAEQADAKMKSGEFDKAAELFKRAYALDPDPRLLYEIGRAEDRAGNADEALENYGKYLSLLPQGEHRAEAEQRMMELSKKDEEVPPPTTWEAPAPPPVTPKSRSVVPWIVIGTGAAGLAGGAVIGALAAQKRQKALDEQVNLTASNYAGEAKDMAGIANIAYAAGGAVVATGIIWLIISRSGSGSGEVAPQVAIGDRSVMISGNF